MFKKNKKFTNNCPTGIIRIIGGMWRGSKILVPNRTALRPTPNRVRETLFNWLAPFIRGAHCLDCFAGSGALGIEALSRAAASVTLIEQDRLISQQLLNKLQLLQTKQAQVITTDTNLWLAHSSDANKFDIVFIDPPFNQGMISKTVAFLEYYNHLAKKSWIYIETEKKGTYSIPINWKIYKEKVAGKVAYRLYLRT
ncbi:16S rRNA (guanine(966)-N(2))-methyltransferase RsmD [secondary endosymbiont of Trabutina mannipara]|uniref:16S rRNA (guanine(966)-N(2))-methyltransferase RsmD n=1 Tax=secondary endosymbiont of Trabutina mannipara TaxID=1835721 RepID=UPI0038B62EF8